MKYLKSAAFLLARLHHPKIVRNFKWDFVHPCGWRDCKKCQNSKFEVQKIGVDPVFPMFFRVFQIFSNLQLWLRQFCSCKISQWVIEEIRLSFCWTPLKSILLEINYNLDCQNDLLQGLKWGIVCLCISNIIRDRPNKYQNIWFQVFMFLQKLRIFYIKS